MIEPIDQAEYLGTLIVLDRASRVKKVRLPRLERTATTNPWH
jgi:hypothetical protein